MNHVNKPSNDVSLENDASLDEKEELFTSLTATASSQINGGYWYSQSSYPSPPRHSYGYGRLPSASHQLAAQRLNQALFA